MEELKTFAQREQEKAQMDDTEFKYVRNCPKRFVESEEDYHLMDDDLEDMLEYCGYSRINCGY